MLYADYARRKMHNVVKLDTKEGYPLTVYSCANTNLKDYTIYGNTGGVGDKFEPYNKYKIPITVTGKNLLNFDGIEDITLDDTTGAIRGGWAFRNLNAGTYTLSANISIPNASLYARIVVNGVSQPTILISGAYQSLTVNDNDTILIYTPSTSATLGKTYLANKGITSLQFEKGTTATSYEPYHEPVTTNIYRDAPLADGESINYKSDNLPDITLKKGTNIITADTEVKPSSIKIKYLKK